MFSFLDSIDGYLRAGSLAAYSAAFVGGLLASFTPCVYPVIPVTVGYIGSRAGGSRRRGFLLSLFYVLGIAVTYAALGMAAALTGRVFGEMGGSPWSYLVVGNICLVLALSLFDVIRIPLPSHGGAASAGRKGIPGAFAFGLASGIIVGPCTAPVLGALLLFVGSGGNVFFGASLLFVFALGMGGLIILLGTFAGLIGSLPRSGKWLEAVKRAFGVLLLLSAEYLFVQAGKLLV